VVNTPNQAWRVGLAEWLTVKAVLVVAEPAIMTVKRYEERGEAAHVPLYTASCPDPLCDSPASVAHGVKMTPFRPCHGIRTCMQLHAHLHAASDLAHARS
jgi:hypothetical protein